MRPMPGIQMRGLRSRTDDMRGDGGETPVPGGVRSGRPLAQVAERIATARPAVLSTDLFDTVLLRDRTTESRRLALAARRAATRLGADPAVLTRLRWSFHDSAYRAVAMERPEGEAALSDICATIAAALGREGDADL